MAEEGSIGILTRWKLWKADFSVSHLSLLCFFHSHSLTHSFTLSLSLLQINLFYFILHSYILYTCNEFNRIDLDFTVPKYSLSFSPGHVSHLNSLTLLLKQEVIDAMCHMTWAFFLSLFSITSWACKWWIELIIKWELIEP